MNVLNRAALSHPAFTGVSRAHFGQLLVELASRWEAARESQLAERRGGVRKRAAGAGRKQKLVFTDRLLVTLIHLRHDLPHAALAELFAVDRSTVSGAIREVRVLLAERGFAIPDQPGLRMKTIDDRGRLRLCRGGGHRAAARRSRDPGTPPQGGTPGPPAFVSGKRRQNTIKTTTFSGHRGRMLLSGVVRPGRMHDQTAVRSEGIAEQFRLRPKVKAKVDSGYAGLAREFPGQVIAPPKKPKDEACDGDKYAWRETRRRQSSARICVEHTHAELRQWAPLRRFTGRRETYAETHLAIASLVSDRSAQRATRRTTSTGLVPVRVMAC